VIAGEAGTPEAAEAAFEATPPLPPESPALEVAAEPAPPSAPKAEPMAVEPSVPLADPVPVPGTGPKEVSGASPPPKPSGSGETAKTKSAKTKQGEASRDRGGAPSTEPQGMYYTDKQDRVVKVPVKNEEDSFRRGSQLYQRGQGDKAIEEYLVYLAECEACAHGEMAHYRLAELFARQGRDTDALAHIDPLLKASSVDLRLKAYILRADIDLRSGNVKRAIEGYSAAWNIDAGSKGLPRKIADLYYSSKEYDKALPLYERSIENGSADDEVYFRAATICDGAGKTRDLEKAYGYYKALIERFKSSSHAEYARKRVRFLEKYFYNFK
jgi:tetratricopeptide (TPR) repeat protein